jgi:chaperonin GroES
MRLKPLGARLMVKEVEHDQITESGIVLPDMAKEKPQSAEVVAVATHEDVKVSVRNVVVRKYSGTEEKNLRVGVGQGDLELRLLILIRP